MVSSSTTSRPKTQAGEARAAPSGAAEEISGSFDSAATTSEEENTRLGGPEEQQVEDSPPPMIDKGNGNGGLSASLDSAATTSVQEEPQVIGSGQRANGVGREQQANLGVGANGTLSFASPPLFPLLSPPEIFPLI